MCFLPYKIWSSTLRIWDLLSDGLQYISTGVLSTGGEQEVNSELHLCVSVRAVILLCLSLNLAKCDLGPLGFRADAGKMTGWCWSHVDHKGSAQHWGCSNQYPPRKFWGLGVLSGLDLYIASSVLIMLEERLVPNGSKEDWFYSVSYWPQCL